MTGKTHQAIGMTSAATYFIITSEPLYNPATFAAVIVGGSLGALLPDIDQPAAELWDKIPIVGHTAGKIASKVTFGHRNITHSLIGFVLMGYLIYKIIALFPLYWGIDHHELFIAILLSYAAHLLADSFTVEGIPILFPYQKMFGIPPKPFDGIRIQSGQWFENAIIFPLVNIVMLVIFFINWDKIKAILLKN